LQSKFDAEEDGSQKQLNENNNKTASRKDKEYFDLSIWKTSLTKWK